MRNPALLFLTLIAVAFLVAVVAPAFSDNSNTNSCNSCTNSCNSCTNSCNSCTNSCNSCTNSCTKCELLSVPAPDALFVPAPRARDTELSELATLTMAAADTPCASGRCPAAPTASATAGGAGTCAAASAARTGPIRRIIERIRARRAFLSDNPEPRGPEPAPGGKRHSQ